MLPTGASQQLGRLIKGARQTVRLRDGSSPSQAWVAGRFSPPRTPQQISSFEQGNALPTIEVLAELYAIVRSVNTSTSRSPAEFVQWVAAWLAAKEVRDEAGRQVLREAVELLANTPVRPSSSSSSPSRPLSSLADFPGSDPFTIIFGDRRESRVTSAAECLIYSGSITDVFHLPQLGAAISNSTIESDKLLVRMPKHFLVNTPEIAERNLLIVGSPAANWGARILNEVAVFPFRIDQNVVDRVRWLMNDSRMQDRDFASWFWEFAQVDPERRKNLESGGIGAWFLDPWSGSWASLHHHPQTASRCYRVRQRGPRRIWDEVEAAYHRWCDAGSPRAEQWTFTLTPAGQQISLSPTRTPATSP